MVRVKISSLRRAAWFSQARPWRGRGAWGPCAMGAPHDGEAVRCGYAGFSKRWKRSEALECYHMFASTKKAPLQRFCEPREHGVRS